MIRWRLYLMALVCCLPFVAGQTRPAQKPIMFVIHADWCPPCRHFDRVYCERRDVRDALQDAFDVRELDWDKPAQRAEAIAMGVTGIPSYVAVRGHQRIAMSEGFTTRTDTVSVDTALAKLMRDLYVEWPRLRTSISPDPPPQVTAPDPKAGPAPSVAEPPTAPALPPYIPHIDQMARHRVDQLASQTRELQATQQQTTDAVTGLQADVADVRSKIGEVQSHVEQSREQITQSLQETQASTQTELRSIADRLRESIEQGRETITPDRETIAVPRESMPDISTEILTGPTAGKWLKVLGWIGSTGVTLAAPEFALPLSVGLTAAGFVMNQLRRRRAARAPAALGHASNPITISDPSTVKTDTKFVVHEMDVEGEAYKEAIRRVGNQNRESQPYVMDLLKQVDGVAQQLAHGRRIVRRPKTEPTSETI